MIRDIDALKALLTSGDNAAFTKALTTAGGFVGYNLESTAKLMLPLYAGLRNRLPVDKPKVGGPEAVWRMQLGYKTSGNAAFDFGAAMGTAFGGAGSTYGGTAVSVAASYRSQAVNGSVQWEAIPQADGFDDPFQIETSRGMATMLKLDELLCLGGNVAALATPTNGTAAPSTLQTTNTFAQGHWYFKITPVTLQGALTNATGNSTTGEGLPCASIDCNVVSAGGAQFIDLYWDPVPGAVGYKIYGSKIVNTNTNWYLVDPATQTRYRKITSGATDLSALGDAMNVAATGQTYVTVNHVQVVAIATSTTEVVSSDLTASTIMFDGLIPWCQKTTMYGTALGGTHFYKDMQGAKLTTGGAGVDEFDYILGNLWTTWQINPTLIITSANGASSLTNQLIAANSGFMYRVDVSQERGQFTGGVYVGGYLNKFVASMMGQGAAVIPVWAHPYMPDGSYLFIAEQVPYQYSREGRGFALDVQTPYTYFPLYPTTSDGRIFPFSLFFTETLKCYHPLAQAYIAGARVQ